MAKIRRLFLMVTAIMMIGFAACDKKSSSSNNGGDGGGTNGNSTVIEGKNILVKEGSDNNVNFVKLMAWDEYDNETVLASAPYQNHSFKLTLPTTVDGKLLYEVSESFGWIKDNEHVNVTNFNISNSKAQWCDYMILCAFQNNNHIGSFDYGEIDEHDVMDGEDYLSYNDTYVEWVYSDKDVTINISYTYSYGEYIDNCNYNLTLKQGWNWVYCNDIKNNKTYTCNYTSQKPNNATYKWYFYGDDDDDNYSKNLQKSHSHKAKFGKKLKK